MAGFLGTSGHRSKADLKAWMDQVVEAAGDPVSSAGPAMRIAIEPARDMPRPSARAARSSLTRQPAAAPTGRAPRDDR